MTIPVLALLVASYLALALLLCCLHFGNPPSSRTHPWPLACVWLLSPALLYLAVMAAFVGAAVLLLLVPFRTVPCQTLGDEQ